MLLTHRCLSGDGWRWWCAVPRRLGPSGRRLLGIRGHILGSSAATPSLTRISVFGGPFLLRIGGGPDGGPLWQGGLSIFAHHRRLLIYCISSCFSGFLSFMEVSCFILHYIHIHSFMSTLQIISINKLIPIC